MQMEPQSVRGRTLPEYVDALQQSGRYSFASTEARDACGLSPVAFKQAARRLVLQSRLASPRRGFFVIVPLEYRSMGAPPPSWYIDALMSFHGRPYYVGVLSAAALHGAAHQQPQEFQVVTDLALRPAVAGKHRLRFIYKKRIAQTQTVRLKTETGSMIVSSPEATAVDMVLYPQAAGGIGNIVTVFSELAERVDPDRLVQTVAIESGVAAAQRVGLLLDRAGAGDKTGPLAIWVADRQPRAIPLRADLEAKGAPKDERWRLLVNEKIEVDE
jgi:predicted transcriptional regulator of viral defense system